MLSVHPKIYQVKFNECNKVSVLLKVEILYLYSSIGHSFICCLGVGLIFIAKIFYEKDIEEKRWSFTLTGEKIDHDAANRNIVKVRPGHVSGTISLPWPNHWYLYTKMIWILSTS